MNKNVFNNGQKFCRSIWQTTDVDESILSGGLQYVGRFDDGVHPHYRQSAKDLY